MLKKWIAGTIFTLLSAHSVAADNSAFCTATYCQYDGTIERIYLNENNFIIVYFNAEFDKGAASAAGITTTFLGGGAVNGTTKPEYAKMFYSTALAAQATGRKVKIQMQGTEASYAKITKIWLYPN